MSTNILVTDDRLSFSLSLADFLRVQGLYVCVTSESGALPTKDIKKEQKIGPILEWNRNSVFSTQSLALQLKNLNIAIDTAVIVFDAPAYAELYTESDALSIEAVFGELITANMQLLSMLIDYFTKQRNGKLIFVHRDVPIPCHTISVAAASSAFVRLAEEIAASYANDSHSFLQTLLVKLDSEDNEAYADWIVSQIQQDQLTRSTGRWVKAGQRGFFAKASL